MAFCCSYVALDNRLTMTTHINASDVVGKTITYACNEHGRLTRLSDWDGQQTQYGYDAVGRLTEVHFPNEVVGTYIYNTAGQLTGLVYQRQGRPWLPMHTITMRQGTRYMLARR